MASRNIEDLIPKFRPLAKELLKNCLARGVEMRPNQTLRDPFEQARLWRQSRTIEQIKQRIEVFKGAGATFLAHCLESVGPQSGDHVTDAPPGLSWHQWGEALDCFWVVDGKADFSVSRLVKGVNGYRVYVEEAAKLGLTPGGLFKKLKDFPHVQFRPEGSPTSVFNLAEISAEMEKRFGKSSRAFR
ncbi:MAG: M15 family metallopeptidase [Blastocatellia bacterium]